jgi:hypothetical protein
MIVKPLAPTDCDKASTTTAHKTKATTLLVCGNPLRYEVSQGRMLALLINLHQPAALAEMADD